MGAYEEQLLQSEAVTENENYFIGIDGVLAYEQQCMFVVRIQMKSNEGEQRMQAALEQSKTSSWDYQTPAVIFQDGREVEFKGYSTFRYGDIRNDKLYQSYVFSVDASQIGEANLNEVEKIRLYFRDFDDLSIDAQVGERLQTLNLAAEGGSSAEADKIHDVKLSPIGFRFQGYGAGFRVRLIRAAGGFLAAIR